eukprot:1147499-Pelagomonas_calceolata.AAC.8
MTWTQPNTTRLNKAGLGEPRGPLGLAFRSVSPASARTNKSQGFGVLSFHHRLSCDTANGQDNRTQCHAPSLQQFPFFH